MTNYITIDGGTTNTRINLVSDFVIKDTLKFNIGAAAGLENKELLKNTIKAGIAEILKKNNLQEKDIKRILASGMITSEGGLCNLEHLKAPCGICELANGLYETKFENISEIPFVFARGVKTLGENFSDIDMMRGEETELMGLGETIEKDSLYVLPGSHSKLVYTDEKGRIYKFTTELTGELISAISKNTILKGSIDLKPYDLNEEFLELGYTYTKENGINAALFKVRILDKLLNNKAEDVFSFFIGTILTHEIENIIKSDARKVVICGKHELREPTALLVKKHSDKKVVTVSDEVSANASTYGIIRIYEHFCKKI